MHYFVIVLILLVKVDGLWYYLEVHTDYAHFVPSSCWFQLEPNRTYIYSHSIYANNEKTKHVHPRARVHGEISHKPTGEQVQPCEKPPIA